MTNDSEASHDIARYRSLGLVANPFAAPTTEGWGTGNPSRSRGRLESPACCDRRGRRDRSRPSRSSSPRAEVPSSYSLRAIGNVEHAIGSDDSLNVVHAYIQLYMMRKGRVRSTLGAVGERVAFRSFDETLASYIATMLAEPDEQLAAFQVLGAEGLSEFADLFAADPVAVTREYFGTPEIERQPALAQLADIRVAGLDQDADESEDSAEVDVTIGDAPGTAAAIPSAEEEEDLKRQAVVDYLDRVHLHPPVQGGCARPARLSRSRACCAVDRVEGDQGSAKDPLGCREPGHHPLRQAGDHLRQLRELDADRPGTAPDDRRDAQ